jgi:type IV pilus assembly protein PilA
MLKALQRRLQGEREEGFTLIELMVVVLIIAILIAIAIPTFLGARARAQDRAAQSSLRNALAAAKTLYTDTDSYATANTTNMKAAEGALTYSTSQANLTASPSPNVVSVNGTATVFTAAVMSNSGTCFYLRDTPGSTGTEYHKVVSATACNANSAPGSFSIPW